MLKIYEYNSTKPGPKVLFFGAIHGNEVCGPKAINQIIKQIESKKITINNGKVIFAPICNPRAFEANKRLVEENLNRVFRKTKNTKSYEAKLANELCKLVDNADIILDLHSSNAKGPVNVFVDYPNKENLGLAKILEAEYLIFDWPKTYENQKLGFQSYTTDWYAHKMNKIGLTLECGQHTEAKAVIVGQNAIIKTLEYFKIIKPQNKKTAKKPFKKVYMTTLFAMENKNDKMLKNWQHLELVKSGTPIAKRTSGKTISFNKDGVIIFPKAYAEPGGEWFYWGELKK